MVRNGPTPRRGVLRVVPSFVRLSFRWLFHESRPESVSHEPSMMRGGGSAATVVAPRVERNQRRPSETRRRKVEPRESLDDDEDDTVVTESSEATRKRLAMRRRANEMTKTKRSALLSSDNNKAFYDNTKKDENVKCCEKCDSRLHETARCPWFKKDRERHPDSNSNSKKKILGDEAREALVISRSRGRVVPQPPDGSCLFHSLSYGLKGTHSAASLRRDIANFIRKNPDLTISETPLRDWIKWESLLTVTAYTAKMSHSGWGGGVELAATARLKNCTIEVYEPNPNGYKRISVFNGNDNKNSLVVRVLYRGGVHYDALVLQH